MDNPTGRRDALRQMAGGAFAFAALNATACAAGATSTSTAPAPGFKSQFDMSWLQKINKRRRMVFDTNDVSGGAGLSFVATYLAGAREAYGDPDASTVLVHRHSSVPIVLGDDIWRRMGLGESLKLKDPTTGETTQRNPFRTWQSGDKHSMVSSDGSVEALLKAGTIILACNYALTGYVNMLANKEKIDREQAKKDLFGSLIPGVYVVPNGVFGVCAAQEANCGYIAVR